MSDDPYRDFADVYDVYIGTGPDDLPVYRAQADQLGGPIIEIGAGAGRITLPLARHGLTLVAVDLSAAMLALLASRLATEPPEVQRRVHVIRADAQRLPLRGSFPLILLPYYTLNYLLTAEAQRKALADAARLLAHGGCVMVDVFVPIGRIAHCPPEPMLRRDTLHADGRRVRAWTAYALDPATQVERRRHIFESTARDGRVERRDFHTERRWITLDEMARLAAAAGLAIERAVSGYGDAPADARAEQVLYTLRAAT
ncbi:MAG TPA: methyltransferase domain-containing protein [Methylomirabilota bacterium]|nr:methyltransferase domain-containing protein [Methylomirabilota bacterium]